MVFYKMYKYSVKATLLSAFSSFLSLILALFAVGSLSDIDNGISAFVKLILFAAAAVFCFVYLSRQLPDKIAKKDFDKKIKTNAKFAYSFCKENPQYFESVAAENPEFAEKYRMDADGKIVKID